MKQQKYTALIKSIYAVYFCIVLLFLADAFTAFEIKWQPLKTITYTGFLVATPLILTWNLSILKRRAHTYSGIILPVAMLMIIFWFGPLQFIFAYGAWHTQTILYQNKKFPYKKIEYQTQDTGAFGYNQRTVEALYITPLFMIAEQPEEHPENNSDWKRVTIELNEAGLKQ